MGLSRLSKKCRECKYVDTCSHKRMEALAYLDGEANNAGVNASAPIVQPHDYREIKISTSMTATIDIEDMKRKLEQSRYPSLFQYGG